mmetsp:Transcript_13124/g.36028  ORF Transcript_13124/g.36028 Transcript_13124/m.36028 type:complete len:259 (-) Transcript_13124:69-845(-)
MRWRSNCFGDLRTSSERSRLTASAGFMSCSVMSAAMAPKAVRPARSDPRGHAACASCTSALSGVAGSYWVAAGGERTAAQLRSSMTLGFWSPSKRSMSSLSSSTGALAGFTPWEAAASASRRPQSVSGSAQTMSSAKPSGSTASSDSMASESSEMGQERTRTKSPPTGSKNQLGCNSVGAPPSKAAATWARRREGGDTWSSPQKATRSPEQAWSSSSRPSVSASACLKSLSKPFSGSGAPEASSSAPTTTTSWIWPTG